MRPYLVQRPNPRRVSSLLWNRDSITSYPSGTSVGLTLVVALVVAGAFVFESCEYPVNAMTMMRSATSDVVFILFLGLIYDCGGVGVVRGYLEAPAWSWLALAKSAFAPSMSPLFAFALPRLV